MLDTYEQPGLELEEEEVEEVLRPQQNRAIRTNNPGNLRPPDEQTGFDWWGKHGFVGLDKDGFAMFDSPQGGLSALEQQIKIDQERPNTGRVY